MKTKKAYTREGEFALGAGGAKRKSWQQAAPGMFRRHMSLKLLAGVGYLLCPMHFAYSQIKEYHRETISLQ